MTEEDTEDRNNWRWKIRCGDPWCEKPEEEEVQFVYKLLLKLNIFSPQIPVHIIEERVFVIAVREVRNGYNLFRGTQTVNDDFRLLFNYYSRLWFGVKSWARVRVMGRVSMVLSLELELELELGIWLELTLPKTSTVTNEPDP